MICFRVYRFACPGNAFEFRISTNKTINLDSTYFEQDNEGCRPLVRGQGLMFQHDALCRPGSRDGGPGDVDTGAGYR